MLKPKDEKRYQMIKKRVADLMRSSARAIRKNKPEMIGMGIVGEMWTLLSIIEAQRKAYNVSIEEVELPQTWNDGNGKPMDPFETREYPEDVNEAIEEAINQ